MKRKITSSSRKPTSAAGRQATIPTYIRDKVDRYNATTKKQEKLYTEIQKDIDGLNKRRR